MKIVAVKNRTPEQTGRLLEIWEDAVRATHLFLSEDEIQKMKAYVPQALQSVACLFEARDDADSIAAFMGIADGTLEMLFVAPSARGRGFGKRLLQYGVERCGVRRLTVNEQNPQAIGFYQHMGFAVYKRTPLDEQGNPYPLLYMRLPENNPRNTPALQTERLLLRRFTEQDTEALFRLLHDREVNRFLPWCPVQTLAEARLFYTERYASVYAEPRGYAYAVCLKTDGVPIGYINVAMEEPHDLGYALRKEFWRRGILTEAGKAVVEQVKKDGLPYITATHDRNNPGSGGVMQNIGMKYQYSYTEQWQPKNILVTFRLYQLNLDGCESRVCRKYWEASSVRFIEPNV